MTRRENAIRRRHPRVPKQTRQTGIGQSICIHHISDLISRVFSAFLKREASSSPSSWERDHFPTLRLRSATHQHLCFPLYHFVTSLSLSLCLSTLLSFYPLAFSLSRCIDASVHTFAPSMVRLFPVYTGGKERRKTSTGWKVLPLIHG